MVVVVLLLLLLNTADSSASNAWCVGEIGGGRVLGERGEGKEEQCKEVEGLGGM